MAARIIVDAMSVFKTVAGQAVHLDRGYAYSFMTQLNAVVKKFKPSGLDICWEGGFAARSQLLPDYKSNRVASSQELVEERAELQALLYALGADQYVAPGFEADDMVAYLANTRQGPQIILSNDKDMLQLVRRNVSVYQRVRGAGKKSNRLLITPENFRECTGFDTPEIYLKAHCALGDSVDKIPKLMGVGAPVIHAYFLGMEITPGKKRMLEEFYADSPQYLLNRKLIDLTQVKQLEYNKMSGNWSEGTAYKLLTEMGFNSIASRFDTWIEPWYKAGNNANVSTLP